MAGRYIRLFRNRRYLSLNLMMAFGIWPLFSFIGGSADIYIRRFGLSEQAYSYFFAFNAAALMAGFYACGRLLKRFPSMTLMMGGFAGVLLGGLVMAGLSGEAPWRMALPMAFISICLGVSRPLCLSLVLDQVETDVGAASSLMMFTYFSIGSLAMWTISQPWRDKIQVLATTAAASALMVLLTLILFRRAGMRRPAVQPVGRIKP
jgi:DHA1 family bicyclomycin/chloramphenicol resistance-like MFS transporter